jgi:hypothetical protein
MLARQQEVDVKGGRARVYVSKGLMVLLLNRESDGGEVLEEGGKGGERESERERERERENITV